MPWNACEIIQKNNRMVWNFNPSSISKNSFKFLKMNLSVESFKGILYGISPGSWLLAVVMEITDLIQR